MTKRLPPLSWKHTHSILLCDHHIWKFLYTHQIDNKGEEDEGQEEVEMKHHQPKVLDPYRKPASSNRGEYTIVDYGPGSL